MSTPKSNFKGDTEGLEGHIYDVGVSNQAELFTNTTKKVLSYAGRSYSEAQDIRIALETISEISIKAPKKETTGDDTINTLILNKEVDAYIKRKHAYRQNKAYMFSVILGQCTDAMKAKLEKVDFIM